MKRFRITAAALGLALTLLPVGAFADDTQTATATAGMPTNAESDEEVEPILDLVFSIDTSSNMQGYMPAVKAAIQSLVRREQARYPGYMMRIGMVRHGDVSQKHFVLDLSEDQTQFLENLQDTQSEPRQPGDVSRNDARGMSTVNGDVLKDAKEMAWSKWFKKNRVRRMYMIGSGLSYSSGWAKKDFEAARDLKLIVSTAFCTIRPFGDPRATDDQNVFSWVAVESAARFPWIALADQTGGEFIELFSHKDGTTAAGRPLLGLIWQPNTALVFNRYVAKLDRYKNVTFDQHLGAIDISDRRHGSLWVSSLGPIQRQHWPGDEASVIRWFEQHPSRAIYMLRP